MSLDGSNLKQLTTMKDGACQPDWSPDGRKLIFINPCPSFTESYSNTTIFELEPETGALNTLTRVPGGDFDPAYSPDGRKIAFTSLQSGPSGVFIMDTDGQNRVRLSKAGAKEAQPRWSPDSQKIIFTRYLERSIIFTLTLTEDPAGRIEKEITHNKYPVFRPDWSPDGLSILFLYANSNGQMWITSETNTFTTNNRTEPYSRTTAARFSPDGMWILFDMRTGNNVDLYRMPVFGSREMIQVTTDAGVDTDPAWRPLPSGG
jgi:Tol biopolymer transport system component